MLPFEGLLQIDGRLPACFFTASGQFIAITALFCLVRDISPGCHSGGNLWNT
jgi:hypothetical protein